MFSAISMSRLSLVSSVALICGCLAVIAHGQEQTVKGPQPDRSVVYKTIDGIELRLHIFEPDKQTDSKKVKSKPASSAKIETGQSVASKKPAAIVFFFGGGWVRGTPAQFYTYSKDLSDHGIVAISAEYRVKNQHKATPFECVKDGKSAIRWLRQHADKIGIDANRIVAGGGSAGGHVAACTGVIQGYQEDGEDKAVSSVPNALVLFNPVIDTSAKGYGANRFKRGKKTVLSPCHHVRKGLMPTIIFHGNADKTVPWENVDRFTRLMKKDGNDCELVTYKGRGHGFFNTFLKDSTQRRPDYGDIFAKTVDFLAKHKFIERDK